MPKKGKKGTEQRVKGNVQAASSGRMTELLGGGATGFVSFESLSAQEASDDPLLRVHPHFQVVLKQLGKKDSTTKLKALQEYISLCEQEPLEGVTSSLQLWPLMYSKLSMDSDHRVRELSHVALRSCAEKVGKNLGPHVRSLIGPWVSGMCDPHVVSAAAAQAAFSVAFPSEKEAEVIKFGLKAIVTFCSDVILKETPDTFSDPKTMPEDERIQRYERAVVMATQGYGFSLQRLGKERVNEEELKSIWSKLLKENKFWKQIKHSNSLIRNAVTCLIKTLATYTDYISEHPQQFCPLVLSNLNESDPVVVQSQWETALLLISTLTNWYEYVNIQKALLPGVWLLLGNGGYGNTRAVYPCLLPLLSQLMKVQCNDVGLAINFITRLKSGFLSDAARVSSSETANIASALVECSLYCAGLPFSEEGDAPFISYLISLITELADEIFTATTVQFEGMAKCTSQLIEGLVNRCTRDGANMKSELDALQSLLAEKLCEKLTAKDDTKALKQVTYFLANFYSLSSNSTTTKVNVEDTTSLSPSADISATGLFVLPIVSKVIAQCLTKYGSSTPHLSVAQSLIYAVSQVTGDWVDHVTELTGITSDADLYQGMAGLLTRLLISSSGQTQDELLVDCYINTLYAGHVLSHERVTELLLNLSKDHSKLLPLILLKLSVYRHNDEFLHISSHYHSHLFPDSTTLANPHYWSFISQLTASSSCLQQHLELCQEILRRLLVLLTEWSLGKEMNTRLLVLLSQMDASLITVCIEDIETLLLHMLNWLLTSNDVELSETVISCYHHLVSHLPDTVQYINKAATSLIESLTNSNLTDILFCGVLFQCLHFSLLSSPWKLFLPLLQKALEEQTNYITPQLLLKCCSNEVFFSPSHLPLTLVTSLPRSLAMCLLPVIGSCDLVSLHQVIVEGLELEHPLVDVLLSWLPEESERGVIMVDEEVWQMGVVLSLMITVIIKSLNEKEDSIGSLVSSLASSSIKHLLKLSNTSNGLLSKTVQYILTRSSDQFLWSQCLHQLLCCCGDSSIELPAVIELILANEGTSLCSLAAVKDRLSPDIANNSQNPCVIAPLLWINQSYWSTGNILNTTLTSIIEEKPNLFEDLMESSCQPLVHCAMMLLGNILLSNDLISQHWDYLSCTLVTLVQLMVESLDSLSLEGVVLCCRGLHVVEALHSHLMSECPSHLINERSEWVEFFSHTIVDLLLPTFLKTTPTSYDQQLLRYHVCRVLDVLATAPLATMWEESISMVTRCSFYPDQLTAFKLTRRKLSLIKIVHEHETAESQQISVDTFQCCLDSVLDQVDQESVFSNDDPTQLHHTIGYMLLWLLILESIGRCHLEVRVAMIDWIKGRGQLFPLLHGLAQYCNATTTPNMVVDSIKVSLTPSLSVIAGALYMGIAQYIPHLLRQWYLTLDRQTSTAIGSFTTKHVSERLWRQEVENMSSNTRIGNLEVRVCAGVNEIIVIYCVDEFSIELTVCIGDNYPLSPPTIKEGKRAKVDLSLWRKWLLQLSSFVANQNGSILEGLLLWKSNLDKHFAGLDDCMICFSIIHGSNYSLPKMICRTCKKRFHSSCLYKWFSTSNKSSCPLCRNIF